VISEALNYDTVLRLFASFLIKSFCLLYFDSRLHRHQRSLRLWHGFTSFPSSRQKDQKEVGASLVGITPTAAATAGADYV
jgi:hypothetical protein